MNHSLKPDQAVIFQTKNFDDKIYIREQKGYFQKIRRILNLFLILGFIFLPLIQYNGHQAVYFDLDKQKLTLFSITLFPQDLMIFCLFAILAAFLLFYFTRLYGRIWCGYACPQTIWMLMFNWIERRIEGTHRQSQSLDKLPMSADKVIKKLTKHSLWLALSLFTALVFISYFVPVYELYESFFRLEASVVVQGWVYFFMLCTYINGGWIKDKMCLHICPYSRFQSVMFGKETKLITYDAIRGETRGPRKRTKEKPIDIGDCVDCNLCVEVCPVGIDIRQGLQYECINCGLCADACDSVMEKFNYTKGLIKYQAQQSVIKRFNYHLGYIFILAITITAMMGWGIMRNSFEVNVIRDRQSLYRINSHGQAENTFMLKTLNKTPSIQSYIVTVNANSNLLINGVVNGTLHYKVNPGEQATNVFYVVADKVIDNKKTDIEFTVREVNTNDSIIKPSTFYSGNDTW